MKKIQLCDFRSDLIRLEETIIFACIERAQFKKNNFIYQDNTVSTDSFNGSFMDFMLYETEKVHAKVRRYTAPDEEPFFDKLPEPLFKGIDYSNVLIKNDINYSGKIKETYLEHILPAITKEGDCQNYGSSATCDVNCLQAIARRIHYGKFIAEAKFQEQEEAYTKLIEANDAEGIMELLTNKKVEEILLKRVALKAATYGRYPEDPDDVDCKIQPDAIASIYENWIIPLTKEVEVDYLMARI